MRPFPIKKSPNAETAIILHLYYPDLWPVFEDKLQSIDVPFDLFVSVREQHANIALSKISKYHMSTNIVAMPNRGRDVLPFLLLVKRVSEEKQYKYLLKLHSKKSLHRDDGSEWLGSLLNELVPPDISKIMFALKRSDTGVIGPGSHIVSLSKYMGANRDRIGTILERISDRRTVKQLLETPRKYPYFGGTMFWCRLDYILPLLDSGIEPFDFESERGQVDGTAAHAIERIFGKLLHVITGRKMYFIRDGIVTELPEKAYYVSYKYVK